MQTTTKLEDFAIGCDDLADFFEVSVTADMSRDEIWDRRGRTVGYSEPHVASDPVFTCKTGLGDAADDLYAQRLSRALEEDPRFSAYIDAELCAAAAAKIQSARDEYEIDRAEGWR